MVAAGSRLARLTIDREIKGVTREAITINRASRTQDAQPSREGRRQRLVTGTARALTVTSAAILPRSGAVRNRRLAFAVELPIVENDKHVAVHLRRLGLIDDHNTVKARGPAARGQMVTPRMVPEEPAVRRRKTIIERTAGGTGSCVQAAGASMA